MTQPQTHKDWINPNAELAGVDGNAFAVMGFVSRELRRAGNSKDVIDAYMEDAQAADYDHLLRVSIAYCGGLA